MHVSRAYILKFVKLSAGYSFMSGTKTMETLQKLTDKRQLHWDGSC